MGAIGDPYITVGDLETKLGEADDGTFEETVEAVSRAIELYAGRHFNRAEAASARRFRAVDRLRASVDDFWTTDDLAVQIGDDVWDVENVDPRPWNGIVSGQTGWPYFDLFAVGRSWPHRAGGRVAIIQVTAKWGWQAVPAAVSRAALALAVNDQTDDGQSGPVRAEAIGQYSVTYQAVRLDQDDLAGLVDLNPRAAGLLAPYVRYSPWGLA